MAVSKEEEERLISYIKEGLRPAIADVIEFCKMKRFRLMIQVDAHADDETKKLSIDYIIKLDELKLDGTTVKIKDKEKIVEGETDGKN